MYISSKREFEHQMLTNERYMAQSILLSWSHSARKSMSIVYTLSVYMCMKRMLSWCHSASWSMSIVYTS